MSRARLFTRILDSSIWLEDDATRIVWITLLAVMDEDGFCPMASPANVAIRARVSPAAAVAALKRFESPDPMTPEDENEGRRIERVPGGWLVLNAVKHREQVTREEIRRQTRERAQRFRDKKKDITQEPLRSNADALQNNAPPLRVTQKEADITHRNAGVTQSVSEAVSEAEAKQKELLAAAAAAKAAAAAFAKETAKKRNALASSESPASVVFELPLPGDQGEWGVPQKLYDELVSAYPDLSIMGELAKARVWLVANAANRKTPGGMPKFIANWMSRAQNDQTRNAPRTTIGGNTHARPQRGTEDVSANIRKLLESYPDPAEVHPALPSDTIGDVQPAVDGQSGGGVHREPEPVDPGATGPSLFPRPGRSPVSPRPGLAERFRLHR
jgi:hypothetical protein